MQSAQYVCGIRMIDKKMVSAAKRAMPDSSSLESISDTFKALGNRTRVKILNALDTGELCVCDLSAVLGMTISAVSHQLRILRDLRLVKYRRKGKIVYYSVDDEHISKLIKMAKEHVTE